MPLQQAIHFLFHQLQDALGKLTDKEYCLPSAVLSKATIGQHLRHIIEFYQELNNGYGTGLVNYDLRQRDHRIETDRTFAIQQLRAILQVLSKPNRLLRLTASLTIDEKIQPEFQTNYYRELLYNLEHTVHHMAFIRVGIEEVAAIKVPLHFGVAASTLQSRKLCAQ